MPARRQLSDQDLAVLCCPKCRNDLKSDSDDLACTSCGARYPVVDGIPRLLHFEGDGAAYNQMWDYKWTVLDGGKGYNFEIIQPGTAAYDVHNVIHHFEDDGEAFRDIGRSKVAIDIGCGTGQYAVRLLQLGAPRVYAIDLTRGVDVGRKIVLSRFPELADRLIFVQANARFLPIKTGASDMTMALASIHHSGHLEECMAEVARVTKTGGRLAVWIYAPPNIPFGDQYRTGLRAFLSLTARLLHVIHMEALYNVFKRLPNRALVAVLRVVASDTMYRLRTLPVIGMVVKFFTPGVTAHPDKGYRLINLYDAYSPSFSEASTENDAIRWSKKLGFKIVCFVPWRLGFVGEKE
jgi:ubiquinone/menaquinone biosynthesis C-methylase UbiE/uncharacterized protein YbaR (Trm112 family)